MFMLSFLASCQGANAALPSGTSDEGASYPVSDTAGGGEDSAPDEKMSASYRIVTGAADGALLLAGTGEHGAVCRLYTEGVPISWEDPESESKGLRDGMLIEVSCEGILETYPSQFGGEVEITVPAASADSLAALYLQVLNDLWEADSGLNEGITKLAVDLSQTRLSAAEQQAVAWAFYEAHSAGLSDGLVGGTFDELAAEGYFTDVSGDTSGDGPLWQWDDGCLFMIIESPQPGGTFNAAPPLVFTAQKWRSPLGAYYFEDCTTSQDALGYYESYSVGSEAIS